MKHILLIIFFLFMNMAIIVSAQSKKSLTLEELPKVKMKAVGKFTRHHYMGQSDDTMYHGAQLKKNGDFIIYKKIFEGQPFDALALENGKDIKLVRYEDGETTDVDTDPDGSTVYQIKIGKKKYYYFFSGGTGLMRSGSFQNIRFYTLFSESLKPVTFMSAIEYPHSFGDRNKNGVIDFIQFVSSDDTAYSYKTVMYEMRDSEFIQIPAVFNGRYVK